jgi:predicted kinase
MKTLQKPIAFILVGLPGTGKSTWSKPFLDTNQFVHISTDAVIDSIAKNESKTYDEVFKESIKIADKAIKELATQTILNKRNIIWDQTNVSVKARKKIITKLKDYTKVAVVFTCSEELHTERLFKRSESEGKTISNFMMESMKNSFQFPTLDEGFDSIIEVKHG